MITAESHEWGKEGVCKGNEGTVIASETLASLTSTHALLYRKQGDPHSQYTKK